MLTKSSSNTFSYENRELVYLSLIHIYGWDTNEKLKKVIQGALDRGMLLSFLVVVDSRDRKNEATPAYVLDVYKRQIFFSSLDGNRILFIA